MSWGFRNGFLSESQEPEKFILIFEIFLIQK